MSLRLRGMEIADVVTPGQAAAFTIGDRAQAGTLDALAAVHRELLDTPVTATLATVCNDGTVQLTPVWVNRDADVLLLNSVRGRLKDRNLRARPQVSLMLVNPQNAYHWITVYGTVTDVVDEDDPARGGEATANIDDLAESYLGQRPYPLRDPGGEIRVLYKVRPDRVVTFGPVG